MRPIERARYQHIVSWASSSVSTEVMDLTFSAKGNQPDARVRFNVTPSAIID